MSDAPALRSHALPDGQRACVVGAGVSGLVAAKALQDRGIPFDWFEREAALGGNWQIENEHSPAYRSLHINSSRENMELADFPMPEDFPVFGHHHQVLAYFERYAERFDLTDKIAFETEVVRVAPANGGEQHGGAQRDGEPRAWDVTVEQAGGERETRRYGAVLVANGHHWDPRRPQFEGTFDGAEMHSHDYRTPDLCAGEDVLIVGIGNSACDIAVDLARPARSVTLSTRSGAHVMPKYLLGVPLDQWTNRFFEKYLPVSLRRALLRLLVYLSVGDQERYGLPRPGHKPFEEHPTISQELLSEIGHGRVAVKPNVERLAGDEVLFDDGTWGRFDRIIYATGYAISFPFLPDEVLRVGTSNAVSLYRNAVLPDWPGLYVVGLLQPLGAVMPLAEIQSKWLAGVLAGEVALPEASTMRREMRRAKERLRRRYHQTARHTIQVDFHDYMMTIEREIAQGRRRARKRQRGQQRVTAA